jgi:hypothetical protein
MTTYPALSRCLTSRFATMSAFNLSESCWLLRPSCLNAKRVREIVRLGGRQFLLGTGHQRRIAQREGERNKNQTLLMGLWPHALPL